MESFQMYTSVITSLIWVTLVLTILQRPIISLGMEVVVCQTLNFILVLYFKYIFKCQIVNILLKSFKPFGTSKLSRDHNLRKKNFNTAADYFNFVFISRISFVQINMYPHFNMAKYLNSPAKIFFSSPICGEKLKS